MQAKSVSDTVRIHSFYSLSPSSLLPVKDRMKHRKDLSVHHQLSPADLNYSTIPEQPS